METFANFADRFSSRSFDFSALLKTNDISVPVRKHLVHVYTTLFATVFTAAIGVVVDVKFNVAGALSSLASIGLMFYLYFINRQDMQKRFSVLLAIAFSIGINTGPLVSVSLDIDPYLVAIAFFGTSVVFACFTGSAMLEKRRSYFFLYSAMSSAILLMSMIQFANLFARSNAMYTVELYMGLVIFCGYVLVDTQMIIEKASLGDRDYIVHAFDLFLDFVSIFIRLLVVLMRNAQDKRKNEENERRRRH